MICYKLATGLDIYLCFSTGSVGRGRTKASVESSGMEEEDENEADDEEEEMDQDEDDGSDDDDDGGGVREDEDIEKAIAVTLMVEGAAPINGKLEVA